VADLKSFRERDAQALSESKAQVYRLESEVSTARAAAARADESHKRAVAELRSTEARHESLTQDLCELEARGSGASRDASRSAEQVARLEQDLRTERQRSAALERTNQSLVQESEAARAEASALRGSQDALKSGEMAVVESISGELRAATTRCDKLCDEVSRLRRNLESAHSTHGLEAEGWVQERSQLKTQLSVENELLLENAHKKHAEAEQRWAKEKQRLGAIEAAAVEAALAKAQEQWSAEKAQMFSQIAQVQADLVTAQILQEEEEKVIHCVSSYSLYGLSQWITHLGGGAGSCKHR
jgi:chromosome segregation ATPase